MFIKSCEIKSNHTPTKLLSFYLHTLNNMLPLDSTLRNSTGFDYLEHSHLVSYGVQGNYFHFGKGKRGSYQSVERADTPSDRKGDSARNMESMSGERAAVNQRAEILIGTRKHTVKYTSSLTNMLFRVTANEIRHDPAGSLSPYLRCDCPIWSTASRIGQVTFPERVARS